MYSFSSKPSVFCNSLELVVVKALSGSFKSIDTDISESGTVTLELGGTKEASVLSAQTESFLRKKKNKA